MNREVIEIQVRAVLPLEGSFAVFLGNEEKIFVIYVDESVGTAISMFMRGVAKERPLTHDLIGSILLAFGGRVDRIVINEVHGSVFHARLILSAENELHQRKVIEIDARPSDSIALAVQQNAPIFVAQSVWEEVEDVTDTLEQIEKRGLDQGTGVSDGDDDEDEEDEDLVMDDDDDDDEEDDDEDEEDEDDDDEGEEWKRAGG